MFADYERDQLKEIINVGAGNAANALAKLIGQSVKTTVPTIHLDRIERLTAQIGDPVEVVTAILMKINGEAPGIFFLLIPTESAAKIADILTSNHKKELNVLDSFDRSALQEVGNILAGSSLGALSKFSGLSFIQSVPEIVTDSMGAILNSILVEVGDEAGAALLITVNISVGNGLRGDLFFFFDTAATGKMLNAVEQKLKS
ncbi:MAG: chemotaxis protein CheC [Candidatus Uhrbacteria bacterium]